MSGQTNIIRESSSTSGVNHHGTIAAVDLGSNSFHMVVARLNEGGWEIIDRLKESVRLAGGFDAYDQLTAQAIDRALDCLKRFNQRLKPLATESVRAVGTNTFRRASNSDLVLERAEQALGYPIDIISGIEEARLIYLGASLSLMNTAAERRLVVDIGGGSTEIILGQGLEPEKLDSLFMGCVAMTQGFFADGEVNAARLKAAEIAARQELEAIQERYQWRETPRIIGVSGTIRAIEETVRLAGWTSDGISAASLARLSEALADAGHIDRLKLKGLNATRKPVFAGGFSILRAVFNALGIEHMDAATGSLREGVLHDLIGRLRHTDGRDATVTAFAQRYGVDKAQAKRVEASALLALDAVASEWGLQEESCRYFLSWAAELHEIGLSISHAQHHKHGAYLLEYADLAGFSRQEQLVLAVLVRAHRRKFPLDEFERLSPAWRTRALRLAMLLRLAIVLHRARIAAPLPILKVKDADKHLNLAFSRGWLEEHPLTCADLKQEEGHLKAAGFKLEFGPR